MREQLLMAGAVLYGLADLATMVYLTFLDCYVYTWWNWLVALPLNFVLATVWPVYWAILRPIFGGGCS